MSLTSFESPMLRLFNSMNLQFYESPILWVSAYFSLNWHKAQNVLVSSYKCPWVSNDMNTKIWCTSNDIGLKQTEPEQLSDCAYAYTYLHTCAQLCAHKSDVRDRTWERRCGVLWWWKWGAWGRDIARKWGAFVRGIARSAWNHKISWKGIMLHVAQHACSRYGSH